MGTLRSILKHPDDFYPLLKLKIAARNAEKQIPPEPHWAFCYTMLHKVSRSFALVIQQLGTDLRNAVSSFRFLSRFLISIPPFLHWPRFSFPSGLHILSGSASARHRWFVFVYSIGCARFLLFCFFVACDDEWMSVLSVLIINAVWRCDCSMLCFYFFYFLKLWMLCRDWCYRPTSLGNDSDFKILLFLEALENGNSIENQ